MNLNQILFLFLKKIGYLIGYKVQIKGNGIRLISVNASTHSLIVHNLSQNIKYNVKIAAVNDVGIGPYSNPVPLTENLIRAQSTRTFGPLNPILRQTWFLVMLTLLFLACVMFALAIFLMRRKQLFNKQLGHLNIPVMNATQLGVKDNDLWIDRGWKTTDCNDKDSSMPLQQYGSNVGDYAEVDNKSLSTFYHSRQISMENNNNPTPYATTMLIPHQTWSEIIPPPPSHPPPHCPLSRNNSLNHYSNGNAYNCWSSIHNLRSNVMAMAMAPATGQSCCDTHCSSRSNSSQQSKNAHYYHHHHHHHHNHNHNSNSNNNNNSPHFNKQHSSVDIELKEKWRSAPNSSENDQNSYSSGTCCSCSESSCLYTEAGPSK